LLAFLVQPIFKSHSLANFKSKYFMSWWQMILISIGLVALLVFLVRRNFKDEKKIEKQFRDEELIAEKRKDHKDEEVD
jgi:maltodextrin utilization protein YvdJ